MISIKADVKNRRIFYNLKYIDTSTKKAIKNSLNRIGDNLVSKSKEFILDKNKTGLIYRKRLRGVMIYHQASAAGESPANFSGDLKNSIGYENKSGNKIIFGAGMPYSKYLELGTKRISPRPYLIKSINENKDKISEVIEYNIRAELNKRLGEKI